MFHDLVDRFRKPRERVYLDHAAATPVREEVLVAMAPYFREHFGNPSAGHTEGVTAHAAVERARERIAKPLHTKAERVIFTASGTESNNLAIIGFLREVTRKENKKLNDLEVVTTRIEHPSVIRVLEHLQTQGLTLRFVSVDESGRIDEKEFYSLLSDRTALVTFAYVNSEVGVIQDVKRLTRSVKKFNRSHDTDIQVHLDASQAPLWLSCDMDMLGVHLMTLDAGKCCGPKGIGVLGLRYGVTLQPTIFGGDQEFGLRGGTENTPLIVGCAEAFARAQSDWEGRSGKISTLRDELFELLKREIPESLVNGSREYRVANNVNISIPGIDSEFAIISLDAAGIAASTQSACSGTKGGGSAVVRELYKDEMRAHATIRLSLGEETTRTELIRTVRCLKEHVQKMRPYMVQDR